MPRLSCLCGNSYSLSPIPNEQEFNVVWDPVDNQLFGRLSEIYQQATSREDYERQLLFLLFRKEPRSSRICECPYCGRLAVFARGSDSQVALWFQPERRDSDTANSLADMERQKQQAAENQMIAPIEPHRPAPTTDNHDGGDAKMESTVTPEQLLAGAESFIQLVRENLDVELAYDEQSVAWVDGYIERVGQELLKQGKADGPMGAIGSFLGECIRRNFGGKWEQVGGRWAIRFERDTGLGAAYPFSNVRKQFEAGHQGGQDILGFYKTIPVLLAYDKL